MEALLGAYGLSFAWPKSIHKDKVLDQVSIEVMPGDIIALLGPNGSGKSTLLKTISGILPIKGSGCEGKVTFQGQDFLRFSHQERAQKVAYVAPDLWTDFPMSVREVVQMGRLCQKSRDDDAITLAMRKCQCWHLRDRSIQSLSTGERQLVALARAIAQNPRVLLLDESLSRMDLNHQSQIGRLLKELASQQWGIVMVSHDLNLSLEWANKAVILKNGFKKFDGPLREVITHDHLVSIYPETDLIVGSNPVTGSPKVFIR